MEQFLMQNSGIIFRLAVAAVLGMIIGAERLLVHKDAGMKTHALVSMGAALFVIISEYLAIKYSDSSGFNPAMIPANIIVGVGFIGAGLIIFQNSRLMGLTTAGGLWVTAGIGMAAGFGLFSLAAISTALVLIIFVLMNIIEKPIKRISDNVDSES
jgi:putative Mg2+ transporter-C (MgtC) family protein